MTAALFAAWCGAVWRMRGGAFAAAAGINIGTQPTRAACGLLMAAPLAWLAHDWWLLGLAPAVFLGLLCVGWAPFMAYGADGNAHVAGSPFDVLPDLLRVPRESRWTDALAWLQIGLVCFALSAAWLAWLGFAWWWLIVPALAFAGVYWLADNLATRLPSWRVVDTPEAWAELVMGVVIGGALALAVLP